MATFDEPIDVHYDESNDILYGSRGVPQAALSYEISKDIWLDHVPPNQAVVGVTVLNFLQHYPIEDKSRLIAIAKSVVEELLRTYPNVPLLEGDETPIPNEEIPLSEPTIHITAAPWLQIYTSAAAGTCITPPSQSIGLVSLFEIPRIDWSQIPVKEDVA
jgi:hypothetical protein